MKLIIAAATLATLTACSTSERVGMARNECGQIGYPVGSTEYTHCVERGYRNTTAQQDAVVGGVASAVVATAIVEAFF